MSAESTDIHDPRKSFRPIELVVIVLVIGMLMVLLIPTLLQYRERARKGRCVDNLRAIGLAMHNYESEYRVFPPGITAWDDYRGNNCNYVALSESCDDPYASRVSAWTLILPFMEQNEVYNQYNMKVACCAKENATAVSRIVKQYLCPSNPAGERLIYEPYYENGSSMGVAPTDYGLSIGGNALLTCQSAHGLRMGVGPFFPGELASGVGFFNVNAKLRVASIYDGRSATFMIGEKLGSKQIQAGMNDSIVPSSGEDIITHNAIEDSYIDCPWSKGFIGNENGFGGYSSVFAATAHNANYNDRSELGMPYKHWWPIPMNMVSNNRLARPTVFGKSYPAVGFPDETQFSVNASFPPEGGDWNKDRLLGQPISMEGFRGYHEGGCYFVFGDGAVRFIHNDIDPSVYVGLSSIQGNEIVSDEFNTMPRINTDINGWTVEEKD